MQKRPKAPNAALLESSRQSLGLISTLVAEITKAEGEDEGKTDPRVPAPCHIYFRSGHLLFKTHFKPRLLRQAFPDKCG